MLGQALGVAVICAQNGAAYAGPHLHRRAPQQAGWGQGLQHTFGQRFHIPAVRPAPLQHGETVAAQARQRVGTAQHAAQPFGAFGQEQIARGLSMAVVDVLEVVDVEGQQGQAIDGGLARQACTGLLCALTEGGRVQGPVNGSCWAR